MQTLAEPRQEVTKLWGKQNLKPDQAYRLMKYVLRVDHEGKTALHNVVTGHLVQLSAEEVQALDALPAPYAPAMDALIEGHFLVPQAYDEHKQVLNLRAILRKLTPPAKYITHYTILPTTACNARCYYCFEQGLKIATMTEQVADDTVKFIAEHCGPDKKVRISWFGGEPTVATHRIDQICKGLQDAQISYEADITTNGYLFDEEMVQKAKDLWHLKSAMIAVDGTEANYNKIKAYVNPGENPYERVMRNVGLLLQAEIHVNLRMNFDVNNYMDFEGLVNEAKRRFGANPYLRVTVHAVIGEYVNPDGEVQHGTQEWFEAKIVELNNVIRRSMPNTSESTLPYLRYSGCQATGTWSTTITADGHLARCPEQTNEDQVTGNLTEGETNTDLIYIWNDFTDPCMCQGCAFNPYCQSVARCNATNLCYHRSEHYHNYEATMRNRLQRKEGVYNVF